MATKATRARESHNNANRNAPKRTPTGPLRWQMFWIVFFSIIASSGLWPQDFQWQPGNGTV
jgi:hypothetical protein